MEYLWWSHFVTTNYGCTASLKKYVNTYHWCLLCKDAYLGNTKTVRLLCIAVVGFFLLFFFQNWALVHSWQIGFFFFLCWLKKPPVNSTEGTAPVTLNRHTRTRARMNHFWPWLCLQCIRSDNQVFSQRFFFFFYALRALQSDYFPVWAAAWPCVIHKRAPPDTQFQKASNRKTSESWHTLCASLLFPI